MLKNNLIDGLAMKSGHLKRAIMELINKGIESFHATAAQRKKKVFITAIQYMKSLSLNFKCELKKFNLNVSITPNRSFFQLIR